jgi:ABC-type transporter Mla maintaining outer membrane lipid asymmetry ATPase subunit MlaF
MKAPIILTNVQQEAAHCVLNGIATGHLVVLRGAAGSGKTTVLERVREERGGVLLGARQFVGAAKSMNPVAIEDAFLRLMEEAIVVHELVLADDLQILLNFVEIHSYERRYLLDAALTALVGEAGLQGCRLVFAVEDEAPWPIRRRALVTEIAAAVG